MWRLQRSNWVESKYLYVCHSLLSSLRLWAARVPASALAKRRFIFSPQFKILIFLYHLGLEMFLSARKNVEIQPSRLCKIDRFSSEPIKDLMFVNIFSYLLHSDCWVRFLSFSLFRDCLRTFWYVLTVDHLLFLSLNSFRFNFPLFLLSDVYMLFIFCC